MSLEVIDVAVEVVVVVVVVAAAVDVDNVDAAAAVVVKVVIEEAKARVAARRTAARWLAFSFCFTRFLRPERFAFGSAGGSFSMWLCC